MPQVRINDGPLAVGEPVHSLQQIFKDCRQRLRRGAMLAEGPLAGAGGTRAVKAAEHGPRLRVGVWLRSNQRRDRSQIARYIWAIWIEKADARLLQSIK